MLTRPRIGSQQRKDTGLASHVCGEDGREEACYIVGGVAKKPGAYVGVGTMDDLALDAPNGAERVERYQ